MTSVRSRAGAWHHLLCDTGVTRCDNVNPSGGTSFREDGSPPISSGSKPGLRHLRTYNDSHMRPSRTGIASRLWSGWTVAALIALAVLAVWLPDLDLPLGDSDDGRILARFGLQARNFWERGPAESRYGALVEPYIRTEYGVGPGETPPRAAVTYAHHPPLQTFASIVSVGLLGDTPAGLRVVGFLLGAATVLFMTALLRIRGIGWGPALLAVGAMSATGFYFVYGRIGVGFSLIVAAAAAVAYLREAPDPPRSVLAAGAVLAGLTAMQSWIAMAAIALLVLWLIPAKGWAPATRWTALGVAAGVLITAAWLINATDSAEIGNQVALRIGTDKGTFGEFLARQWRFAAIFTPVWFRVLAPFALLAGLADRRTRVPVAVTLGVAAAWTFGFQQGAWVHVLWNFPWVAPVTIGLAALVEAGRQVVAGRVRLLAGGLGAVVLVTTLYGVVSGPVRRDYLAAPADAGKILEQMSSTPVSGRIWVTPGIGSPRWVSYYLAVPVWTLRSDMISYLERGDLVLVRIDRVPDHVPGGVLDTALLAEGRYRLVTGEALAP